MSDVNEKLLTKFAALEQEVATLRAAKTAAPAAPNYDHGDPIGSLSKQGADLDYLTKLLVARAMGEQAPPEYRALALQGPQISATRALESKVEQLSRQLTTVVDTSLKVSARDKFKALSADKTKYPALAKAIAADPDFFNEALSAHPGDAEEFAKREEAKLVKLGYYTPPAASDEDADTTSDAITEPDYAAFAADESIVANGQSTQTKPAPVAAPPPSRGPRGSGVMPPIAGKAVGVFTQDDHARIRDEVVRKYTGKVTAG